MSVFKQNRWFYRNFTDNLIYKQQLSQLQQTSIQLCIKILQKK